MANRNDRKASGETRDLQAPEKVDETQVPATIDMAADAGAGLEEADAESFAIPFLAILQKGSPQCDPDAGEFIKDAKPGMFFNTATQELYDGETGVLVLPAMFQRRLVEWIARDQGGGWVGSHRTEDVNIADLARDDSGRWVTEEGHYLADTRYHFCLLCGTKKVSADFDPRPVVIGLSSTQIKKSRNWLTRMDNLRVKMPDGKRLPMATFANVWRLTTVGESNEKGSWKGVRIELERPIDAKNQVDVALYLRAKEFREFVKQGIAQPAKPAEADDIPF